MIYAQSYQSQVHEFMHKIKEKSDRLINYFLVSYFITGILLSYFYDTLDIALEVGGVSLFAYYVTKRLLPNSNLYQYVLSGVLGIFMAQFIYQMHGLFEMHFVAFIGSAMLITYQNWKLQIPLVAVVVVHHAVFGYLQFIGFEEIYFTKLEYMDLQTFCIHVFLAAVIFFICGLWAHHFKKYSEKQIQQTYAVGRLQEENAQKEALMRLSDNLRDTVEKLKQAQKIAHLGSWEWYSGNDKVFWSDEMYSICETDERSFGSTYESYFKMIHPEDRERVAGIRTQYLRDHRPFSYECRIITGKGNQRHVSVQGSVFTDAAGNVIRTCGVMQDITEKKIAEEALVANNTELKKSNDELDKFVYSVSHDLRAPLLSMQGIVEITSLETSEALTREHMNILKGSIGKLDTFIAGILDYSRNNRLDIKPVKVNFEELLSETAANLQYMNCNGIPVHIEYSVIQTDQFCSDSTRLTIILNNLVSNAIRYANVGAERPYVKIGVESDAMRAVIRIEDNGIGIPLTEQQKVFDMFYRVSENSTGSGLGLYIVKETIDKLHGTIELYSEEGKGTTFEINIPNILYQ